MPSSSLMKVAGIQSTLSDFERLVEIFDIRDAWVVGTNTVYGVWLEDGTKKMQPYPWLGPAINEVVDNKGDELADDADSPEQFVAKVALEIEAQAKENVSAQRGSGRSPGTHPDHPQRQSSNLVNSIEAVRLR